jgi:photosystem II stability/assembly factor-like uncharacterized protein
MVIDPANPDIVYVAGGGHLWGSNPDRGVFKTADGGQTWKKTLFVDDNTGATDLVIDPQNPRTLYAAMYQRQRKSWGYNGGGPGSGIYKSTDAGEHWTKLTKGLPAGDKGRIGLDIFQGDGKVLLATVETAQTEQGVYGTSDGGEMWTRLSPQNTRPSYYSQIRIDPKDKTRVYTLGSNRGFYVSNDGGKTFVDTGVTGIHGEDHALWIDSDNTNHLIIGGDGGVSISWDRGKTWDFRMNMPLGQFYEIDADMSVPFRVCGGLQDNGEWCMPSAVRDRNGIALGDAWNIGGGDGFYVKFDPSDGNFAYAESQNGNMGRVNLTTMERQNVKPQGAGAWNWDTPIEVSKIDPKVIYTGSNVLYRSPDRGATWTAISQDLTSKVDPGTLPIMGAPVPPGTLSRNDGTSPHASLTSIGESPQSAQVIYTGAQDGTVSVTRDAGKTWTNISSKFPGLPAGTYVSTVLASKHAAGRVYATFDGHYSDDYKPYAYASDDFGQTWRSLAAGLPETSINRIREHPGDPHFLVLGHERGAHFSNDDGKTWTALSVVSNLPAVSVDDMVIHPRDNALILGTHGRGIWILDDLGPLQALTPAALASDAALAPIHTTRIMIMHNPQAWFGTGTFFAPNPDPEAGINYYLKNAAQGSAAITIADAAGKIIRTMQGPAAKGLNHAGWDLRADLPGAAASAGAAGAAASARQGGGAGAAAAQGRGGRGGGGLMGPVVTPGKYTVTVKVPGLAKELSGSVTVEKDPIR